MPTVSFYDVLVLSMLALLALSAVLVLATLIHHGRVTIQLRLRKGRSTVLLPLLCRAIAEPSQEPVLLAEVRAGDRIVLLPMLLQLALDLRGEECERIESLGEALGIAAAERGRLGRLRATERAEAVKNLGLLRSREALPRLLHLANTERRPEVRLALASAIGEIGGRRAVFGLVAMLDDADPGVVRRAQEVLLDSAPDAVKEIVSHARRTEYPAARRAAVELLGALRDPQAGDLLLELVDAPDAELRTKVVKAAASIADPRFRDTFRGLLADPAWPVRCQAANGIGAVGDFEAIPQLCDALDDEAWWVRFNAASALAELGLPGRAALADATMAPEARRRDVARYVLERTGAETLAA